MTLSTNEIFETPALEGPDYVALVIEWDQLADRMEGEIAAEPTEPIAKPLGLGALAAAAAGLLGVFALARWGIHRMRAA